MLGVSYWYNSVGISVIPSESILANTLKVKTVPAENNTSWVLGFNTSADNCKPSLKSEFKIGVMIAPKIGG
jgi:hypothetical protein